MNKETVKILADTARELGAIARKVNESSRQRRACADKALRLIGESMKIGDTLASGIKKISKTNVTLRNQDNLVRNTCAILKANMARQKELIAKLGGQVPAETGQALLHGIDNFVADVEEALRVLDLIIRQDNEIILMDRLLLMRKRFQSEAIRELRSLAARSRRDAEKAIEGSKANLARGLALSSKLKNAERLIKGKKKGELRKLADDARRGSRTAAEVNRSSTAQLAFAEQVNGFTGQLHRDSEAIRALTVAKHEAFKQNLENITVLTVLISLQFKGYLESARAAAAIAPARDASGEIRNGIHDLRSYVSIACNDIEGVGKLNYDMTDAIQLNAELEIEAVELTNRELACYAAIREAVAAMTEATRYPIEGSRKNMENGRVLADKLAEATRAL